MNTPGVGDFGVVALEGRAGELVRLGQWLNGDGYANYEHAFVVTTELGTIVEGRPHGAGYNHTSAYPNALYYSCPEDARTRVADAAVSLIGTGYSWVDYFALAAVRVHLDLIAFPLRRYVADSGHMICSQLVDRAYQLAGVQLFDDHRLPGDVTPGDLYGLIIKQRQQRGVTS